MPESLSPPLLEIRRISRNFGGVRALEEVRLEVHAREVHCLMGENGAGKSTLLRILAGVIPPDSGEIRFRSETCRFRSPHDAISRGIAMIHQELMPFRDLTVAENIFMGNEPRGRLPGSIDRRKMHADARQLLARIGVDLAPTACMRDLSVSAIQMVEIAKAMARAATLIIMDEPTSSLSHREAEALFHLIGELRTAGVAIIYVTHKMEEVFRLGDRVTVLRDGRYIGTDRIADLTEPLLISRMVGRELGVARRQERATAGLPVLEVENLGRRGVFRDVTFKLRRGEVLGVAGLMGAGRSEIVSAIYGLAPADQGTIRVHGARAVIGTPSDGLRQGIGFVSEDRKQVGLNLGASIKENVTLCDLARFCRAGLIRHAAENAATDENLTRYRIKASGRNQPVSELSGGNQQKVVIAKALLADPQILILDEPTRGIDIGAKQEIYSLVEEWVREGRSIVLISSELPELLALSDRIVVIKGGTLVAELSGAEATPEQILRYAMPN